MENIELINGDCLIEMAKIPNDSIDLIVTDPPYKITSRGSSGTMSGYWTNEITKKGKIFNNNDIEIEDYLPEFYRVLKDGTHCYIMCNHINLPHFIDIINKSKFKFIKCLIWDKCNKICGRYYMGQFEYIIMLRKGRERTINNCGTSDILSYCNKKTKDKDGNNIHDTEKPVALMKTLVDNSSNENDLVLDPFSGSGSTALACIESNRRFIGMEIDEGYYNIAQERINSKTKDMQSRLF